LLVLACILTYLVFDTSSNLAFATLRHVTFALYLWQEFSNSLSTFILVHELQLILLL